MCQHVEVEASANANTLKTHALTSTLDQPYHAPQRDTKELKGVYQQVACQNPVHGRGLTALSLREHHYK